jgi:glycogen operon protein
MILGGDEFLRTQGGNNNAYCQDNELAWFDWGNAERNGDVLAFFRRAIAFVRRYPILQRRKFFLGKDLDADSVADITWFGSDGRSPSWDEPEVRTLCYLLDGGEAPSGLGKYYLFFAFNADHRLQGIRVPEPPAAGRWYRVVDTSLPAGQDFLDPGEEVLLEPPDCYLVNPRSTVVLLAR